MKELFESLCVENISWICWNGIMEKEMWVFYVFIINIDIVCFNVLCCCKEIYRKYLN